MSNQQDEQFNRDLLERLAMGSLKEQRARRRWGVFFKIIFFGYFIVLTVALWQGSNAHVDYGGNFDYASDQKHAAVIQIIGEITADGDNSADSINQSLRRAFESEQAQGIILQINSPGGSAVESNRIYKEIYRLREKYPNKKVYAVAGDLCASGGYFIAAAADQIYADEASLVGSIGVIFSGFGFVGTMDKLGVERRVQTAGSNKNMFDPFSPQDSENTAVIDDILDNIHDVFINAVKTGRADALADNPAIYSGAIFGGADSLRLGLIDGFSDVGGVTRDVVGVEHIVYYNQQEWFDDILDNLAAQVNHFGSRGGLQMIAQ